MLHTPRNRTGLGHLLTLILACASALAAPTADTAPRRSPAPPRADASEKSRPAQAVAECGADAYGQLPLRFEPNHGQTDERVKFVSRLGGYDLFLTPAEAVFALNGRKAAALRMKLAGANADARGAGLDALPGVSNYFKGKDPSKWRTNVPHFSRVQFQGVYPGVDVVYYGKGPQLEYDFRLAPGADPRAISMEFDGSRRPRLDARGDLLLRTPAGEVRLLKPFAYQENEDGSRTEVAARFVVRGDRVRFRLGEYDAARALVIDPCVMYATFLGGDLDDRGLGVGADSQGHAYVAGITTSPNFPEPGEALNDINGTSADAFVAKLSPDGTALLWATYIGGTLTEDARDIAVDPAGNAYITGITDSHDLPTVHAVQSQKGSTNAFIDAYVAKLSPAGGIVYLTYLGGWRPDQGEAIAADSSGSAYITGSTGSNDTGNALLRPFPIKGGAYQPNFPSLNAGGGNTAVFVTKLSPSGALDYSTFLGGWGNPSGSAAGDVNPDDLGFGIAVDSQGSAHVAGRTESERFPTTEGAARDTYGGGLSDAFYSKLNSTGTALLYSTFLGGAGEENRSVGAVAVDPSGNAYVAGGTNSADFPTRNPLQPAYSGNVESDAFIAKFDEAGQFVYSTYIGANNFRRAYGVAADPAGVAYVTGTNTLRRVSADGSSLLPTWSPGGEGRNVVLDPQGNIYIAGTTVTTATNKCTAGNFCPTPGVFQPNPGGSTNDAFVMKFRGDRQPIHLAGYVFDANAAVDDVTLNSTPLAGGQPCSAVNYAGTTTRERVRDALSDACPATSTLGEAKFETHFTNNRVVNLDGPDLVVFEIGGPPAGNEPFTLEVFDPATGAFTAPQTVTPAPTTFSDCANLRINAAEIDLSDFGVAAGAHVSRLRFNNLWVANVNSSGAEISDVLALHSAGLNNPPVADAGPDQTIRETNGSASFTLDGSASSDPDGDALSYVWKDAAGNVVGTSAQVTLSYPTGAHVFTLTVDDGRGGTATDAVQVFINPTAGLQAVVFTNAKDFDEQASEQITFDPLDERTAQSINDKFDAVSAFTVAGGQAGIRHTSQHARNFAGEGTEGGPVSGEYRVDWGYSAESAVTVTFAAPVDSVGAFFGGVVSSGTNNLTVTFEDGTTMARQIFPHLLSVPNGSTNCDAINGFFGIDSNGGPRIVKARFSVSHDASSLDSIYFGQALGGSRGPGPTRTAESPFAESCGQTGVQPLVFTNAKDFDANASQQITFDPTDERTAQAVANKFDAVSAFTVSGGQAAIRHTSQHATNFAGEGTEGGPAGGEYRVDWGYSGESAVTVTFAAPVDSVGAFFGGVALSRPSNLTVTFADGKTFSTSVIKYLPAVPNGSTECQAINGFLGVDSNGGPKIVKARFTSTSDASSLDSIHFGRAAGGSHGPGPTRTAESPFEAQCETLVTRPPVIIEGPSDGTHVGPGTPGTPGRVTFPISGVGTPGCTIRATVEDHRHGVVGVFTTVVGPDGTWTLILDIEDCDVTIRLVQICGGVESEEVTRFVYVDGTPPVFNGGGLLDEVHYLGGGASKATVVLNGGAFDLNTSHCAGCGTLTYNWYFIGSGGTRIEVGNSGTRLDLGGGPGSGLGLELEPGEYVIEVVVEDEFGNQSVSRCVLRVVVAELVTIGGGLPEDQGFYGPGTPGTPGRVRRTISGTGNPECSVNFTVSDPAHPDSESNNRSYTAAVDSSGKWSLDLELEDGHPFVQVVQTCGGVAVETVTRQIYVDGTPPAFTGGGLSDGVDYVTGGGTFSLTLDGSASDPDTYNCEGVCGGLLYEWYLIGDGGSRTLLGGAGGGELLNLPGGPGSGLRIDLAPGVYEFELVVKDPAGNLLVKRSVRRVLRPLTVTGGLPADGGIYGPGTPGQPGLVTRTLTGTGEPGCAVSVAVSDHHMPESTRNNQTYTTTVGDDGNWSLALTLDDCHPLIVVSQSCEGDGGGGVPVTRRVYVDGTPAAFTSGGLADADVYVGGGGSGRIVLDGGASDAGSHVPGNALAYEWYAVGGDGSRTQLCTNCPASLTLDRPLGDYDFEVVVTDTAGNRTADACHVRVLKRPTTVECHGLTVDFAGIASLSSTLKDALTGEVLEGRAVTYKVAGASVPNPFEAYLVPGTYPVEVNFAGDDIYQASAGGGECLLVVRSTPGKITGGGSVDEGVRNFGFVAQTKSRGGATAYTGSLEFQDKSKGYNLHSESVTIIAVSADRLHGVFTGTAKLNGRTGYTFKAWVDDLGEPGAGVDKFRVEINGPDGFHYDSDTYATLGGKLDQGGNIQIHKSH